MSGSIALDRTLGRKSVDFVKKCLCDARGKHKKRIGAEDGRML
jgi:hypothetical protein